MALACWAGAREFLVSIIGFICRYGLSLRLGDRVYHDFREAVHFPWITQLLIPAKFWQSKNWLMHSVTNLNFGPNFLSNLRFFWLFKLWKLSTFSRQKYDKVNKGFGRIFLSASFFFVGRKFDQNCSFCRKFIFILFSAKLWQKM